MSGIEGSRLVLHRGRERIDRLEEAAEPVVPERVRAMPTPRERDQMIAVAAYYRAQRRNFEPGHELEDWLEAEAEVDERLRLA
jgi:phage terminase Nu1 subunit (DNA packaging protein)